MAILLGLDVGTGGAKALLCDEQGRILAATLSEYPISSPQPLWNEQDPLLWWQGSKAAIRQVLAEAAAADPGFKASQIAAIGLTGQMHGSVFLDRERQVIRPAILWNDQRTAAECEEITQKVGYERLIEIAGNPALTGFQAPKILWLRNHEPHHYERLDAVLLPKDYIRLLISGDLACDASDAAGTLLLDLKSRDWSAEILDRLEIPRAWLPRVYEGPEITGHLKADMAIELGLPAGLPVIAGGGDNAAAAVGTGIVRTGVVSSSLGTSGVLFAHSDQIAMDPHGRLHTFCHTVPGKYHLMAVALSGGGSFKWLRGILSGLQPGSNELSYDQLSAAAASTPPGAEGLIFLPYLTGERTPHLDPFARGGFIGLTSRHTPAHLARAVMEGVVYSLLDGLNIMRDLGLSVQQIRATGGGGRSPFWRQMQADIYGTEVAGLRAEEGPAYGAALLAGVGAGVFASVEAASERCVEVVSTTLPDPAAQAVYARVYEIYRPLYSVLKESMHNLAKI